jgi:hypothetical protein
MTKRSDTPGRLILLVGSNPLPNYLSALALKPTEIALVYTRATEVAKNRLKSELRRALGDTVSFVEPDPFVEDATCATTVRRAMDQLLRQRTPAGDRDEAVWLNYTGGTKVMAAHARMAFAESGGESTRSTYLDEGGKDIAPRLRYDNGRPDSLADLTTPELDLRTVLALHGIQHKPRTARDGGPTESDARAILCAVLREPGLAKRLYEERRRLAGLRRPSEAISDPFRPSEHGLELSIQMLPDSAQMNRKLYESWYRFIGGEWLEEWIGTQLRGLAAAAPPEIVVGLNAFRGDARANLEVDVAAVRGHRSYFISCTTDTSKAVCKSKLFEVAIRSRQLGGDLARAALICLADERIVETLRQDIDDLWGATNTTRVFGLSDLREWSNCDGRQPNPHTLQSWMES